MTVVVGLAPSANYEPGTLTTTTITISDTPINDWRLQYFGTNATNPSIAGDNATPAGDGVPNLIKYALGLNPTNAVTGPLYSFGVDTNGFFAISYTRPDPPPVDITYNVDASADLVTWCTNSACVLPGPILFNANGTATVTSESDVPIQSSSRNFLRLSVSRN